jgi:uncharacterized protein (DUF2267 family)
VVTYSRHLQTFKMCPPPQHDGEFVSTNIASIDRAISNAIQWIDDIQEELGWESRDKAYQATKAVLQSIRDRLPIEEVIHLSANLPLIMKGMMMDAYDLKNKPVRIRSIEEFLELVQANYDASTRDIISAEDATIAVLKVLNTRMGGGEMCKVAANMPEKIRRLFREAGVELPETQTMAAPAQ